MENLDKEGYDQVGRPIVEQGKTWGLWGGHVMEDEESDFQVKAAALKVSPSVVAVISHDLPREMLEHLKKRRKPILRGSLQGSGIIIERQEVGDMNNNNNNKLFQYVVIAPASLLIRTNRIEPTDIRVDVVLAGGKRYRAQVLACDFHYNLSILLFQSPTPNLQLANLGVLDDILPIGMHVDSLQKLLHTTTRVKILPGNTVIILGRYAEGEPWETTGRFSASCRKSDCNELYAVDIKASKQCSSTALGQPWKTNQTPLLGAATINCRGDVIGIITCTYFFLPSNLVLMWWNYYKQYRKFSRPWLGMKCTNLHSAWFGFLEILLIKFPSVISGVVVTKVLENSEAYHAGLRNKDIIVQCDDASVQSTMEFYERIWFKVGESVVLQVVRLRSGVKKNLTLIVGEATFADFYTWPIPEWNEEPEEEEEESSSSSLSEGYNYKMFDDSDSEKSDQGSDSS